MCTKKTYRSQDDGYVGALRASRKTGKPMRAYLCHICKKWHLTKKRKNWWEEKDNG